MNNLLVVLDILTVSGVVVCAIIASSCKKLLSSVVALGATGIFAAASFLVMHAPDVAMKLVHRGGGRRAVIGAGHTRHGDAGVNAREEEHAH